MTGLEQWLLAISCFLYLGGASLMGFFLYGEFMENDLFGTFERSRKTKAMDALAYAANVVFWPLISPFVLLALVFFHSRDVLSSAWRDIAERS